MKNTSIKVKSLSKSYKQLTHHRSVGNYRTLRDDLMHIFTGSFLRNRKQRQPIFWALKDIDFEVNAGEVVGIIGPNGSGKSTLLKLLSRVTEPTQGQIDLYGRVGALLEIGTGFHYELTGRENVFLSGSILGMKRDEIKRQFDEIVEFAEIGPFIDTPVKKYSSGMFLRLAFSVMAHLRTEIVIVDEVLAVGDATFQKKCLGKMENVAHQGRTVIYVSHQLETITSLCSRCLFLQKGELIMDGAPRDVINTYYQNIRKISTTRFTETHHRKGRGNFKFTDFWIENNRGEKVDVLHSGSDYKFVLSYETFADLSNMDFEIQLTTTGNFSITTLIPHPETTPFTFSANSQGQLVCEIKKLPLNYGNFHCNLVARCGGLYGEIEDLISHVGAFSVEPGLFYDSGRIAPKEVFLLLNHSWEHRTPANAEIALNR